MFEHTFIGLGFMALFVTVLATVEYFDKTSKVVWGFMGMILWGVWALQSQSVEALSGGVGFTNDHRSLLVVGILFAALMLLSTLMRAFELYNE